MSSTQVKERSILFSAPMVRAILAGTKTQTRRAVKPQPTKHRSRSWSGGGYLRFANGNKLALEPGSVHAGEHCPYGKPGDRLYVKEALVRKTSGYQLSGGIAYAADGNFVLGGPGSVNSPDAVIGGPWPWKVKHLTARYMPRWASRLTLEITDVRVERVEDITEGDAISEGMLSLDHVFIHKLFPEYASRDLAWKAADCKGKPPLGPSPRARFLALWKHINGVDSLRGNPWVWVVSFNRVEGTL